VKSYPFSIRRRFLQLPEEVLDAMYEQARERALFRLKLTSIAIAILAAAIYVHFAVSVEGIGTFRTIGEWFAGFFLGLMVYGFIGALFISCVLNLSSRRVFRAFAASHSY